MVRDRDRAAIFLAHALQIPLWRVAQSEKQLTLPFPAGQVVYQADAQRS